VKCCDEYRCRRRQPYRIRLAPFSKRWVLITRYTDKGNGIIRASETHDVHDDLVAALLHEGWTPPGGAAPFVDNEGVSVA
jgi:hypothetical protein